VYSEAEVENYLEEIRQTVCKSCGDWPAGGPPCGPLAKRCAVELDLPLILQAIRETDSPCMACPVENIRRYLCTQGKPDCSCPHDYVLMLVIQAVRARMKAAEAKKTTGPAAPRLAGSTWCKG
jgi:hypothetical protein